MTRSVQQSNRWASGHHPHLKLDLTWHHTHRPASDRQELQEVLSEHSLGQELSSLVTSAWGNIPARTQETSVVSQAQAGSVRHWVQEM